MVESDSPLAAVGTDERAANAFGLLSNELRLAILLALWEQYEPFDEHQPVRFSMLRDRVGASDSGQFNYHLDQLEGQYVEAGEDGYELTEAGLEVVRSVIAGAGIDRPTVDPEPVDVDCGLCGAPVEVGYQEGWVDVRCSECAGLWSGQEGEGQLAKYSLQPAGVVDRSPAALYAAAWTASDQFIRGMLEGVCPTCSGEIEGRLEICADHHEDGPCPNCGRIVGEVALMHCPVCKDWAQATLGVVAEYHPRVVGFCHEHGLNLQYRPTDLATLSEKLHRADTEVEQLSTDPPAVRITKIIDGESVWVEIGESLQVIAVESHSS